MSGAPLLVCGLPGSGKSTLVRSLQAAGEEAIELDPLTGPAVSHGDTEARVICVVDCANIRGQLGDELLGPLARRQLGCAGLVALSRPDLADASEARAALDGRTDAPVIEVLKGAIDKIRANMPAPRPIGTAVAQDDCRNAFRTWSYSGHARLSEAVAENLIARRPQGLVRLSGRIMTDKGGLEVEIAGRVRQTLACPAPPETHLQALGPRGVLEPHMLDHWFAEAVSDSSHQSGWFGYR